MRNREGDTKVRYHTQWQVQAQWRDVGNGDWVLTTTFENLNEAYDEFHHLRQQHGAGWRADGGKVCVGPRYGLLVEVVEWSRDGKRVLATTAPDPAGPPQDPSGLVDGAAERMRKDLA